MDEIEIRLMTAEDVPAVHEIEVECFTEPWSKASFLREVTENMCARYLVLTVNGEPAGYAGMWLVIDEAHVTNIAVRASERGKGYGEKITRALVQLAADTGCRWMTLECRAGNAVAQSLYHKIGFRDIGCRRGYYADNKEDAILMGLEDLPEGDPERDPFLVRED